MNIISMYQFFLREVINLHKVHGLTRSILFIGLTLVSCFPLVLPLDQINNLAPIIFSMIFAVFLPNILISISKKEFEDGYLEWLLTILSAEKILVLKFISVIVVVITSLLPLWILSSVFFSYSAYDFVIFLLATIFLIIQVTMLGILCFCIQAYFYSNTQFILSIMLPLLLPHLIIFGMIISEFSLKLLFLGIGITLGSVPIYLVLAIYLMKNIYNF